MKSPQTFWRLLPFLSLAMLGLGPASLFANGLSANGLAANGLAANRSSQSASDADQQFALATGHYVRGNYDFAAEELQQFLGDFPADARAPEAWFYLGESRAQLRNFTGAASAYQAYLDLRPAGRHARVALFRVAECQYFLGNSNAEQALREFSSAWPNDELNDYALPYLGLCVAKRDTTAAVETFRDALRKRPQSPLADDCRVGLARCLDEQGNIEESRRLFRALAAKRTSNTAPKARYFLARSYFNTEEYPEAEQAFADLLDDFPVGEWTAFTKLGWARAVFEQGRLDDAAETLAQLKVDPQAGFEAVYWLAAVRKRQQRYAEAIELLLPLADIQPHHELADDALFHAADALRVADESQTAAETFRQLLSDFPASDWEEEAHLSLAQLAFTADDVVELERRIARVYDSSKARIRLGARRLLARSYLQDDCPDQAVAELEDLRIHSAGDDRPEYTRYLLATAYAKAGRPEDALTILSEIELSTANDADHASNFNLKAETAFTQAGALLELERFPQAAEKLALFVATADESDERRKLAAGELVICLIRSRLNAEKGTPRDPVVSAGIFQWRSLPGKSHEQDLVALRVAESLLQAKRPAWAAEVFQDNLDDLRSVNGVHETDMPLVAENLSGLGWSLYRAGKTSEALRAFEDLWKEDPQSPLATEGAMLCGRILEDAGQAKDAISWYSRVTQGNPDGPLRPQALLAAARLEAGWDRQAAAARYRTLLQDYPEHDRIDEALYRLAWIESDDGDRSRAIGHFRRLCRDCERSEYWPDAAYRVALAEVAANNLAAAENLAERILARDDLRLRPYVQFLQGQIAWKRTAWDDVLPPMKQLLGESPQHEAALAAGYYLADALTELERYEQANDRWALLAEQARRNPGLIEEEWPARIALRRAQTLALVNQWAEAREVSEQAITVSAEFAFNYEHQFIIGRGLATAGKLTDARDAYTRVLASPHGAKTETAAKAQLMIAESYFHQRNFEQAVREYLKVEILHGFRPWQAAGLFQAGVCYEKLGKPDRAQEQYRRLVHEFAETEYSERAARRLR